MPRNIDLPSEWPEHLSVDATITPLNVTPPIGQYLLDFSALGPVGFEQFCWWLLRKEGRSLRGCKRIGGSGQPQGGIDIFATEAHDPDRLVVYECKSGKGFSATELKKAIRKFMAGDWRLHASTFILILARDSLEGLSATWNEQKKELRAAGIDADVWTAHTLTLRAQAHPDILSKFFPTYDIRHFANRWMQQTAFLDELQRGIFDPRPHVREWARALSMQAQESASASTAEVSDSGARVIRHGNSWIYKCPWFDLSVFLPDARLARVSASINLHRPDVNGMVIVLSQPWMMSELLFRTGAPATHEHRGFIVGPAIWGDDGQVVDLGPCRLTLEQQGVQALAKAADSLSVEIHRALVKLEQTWDAADFVFIDHGGRRVALVALWEEVWDEMLRFAKAHDVDTGSSPWHMFDAAPHVLKPYTHDEARHGHRFGNGYHAVFEALHVPELCRPGEVLVLWQPPGNGPEESISPRAWWSCRDAFSWLTLELLPEVRRWIQQRHFGQSLTRLIHPIRARRFTRQLQEMVVARDVRRSRGHSLDVTADALIECVQTLQSLFSIPRTPPLFVRQGDVETLYLAAARLAGLGRGYVGYVCTKLGLDEAPEDRENLSQAIAGYVHGGHVTANSAVVDHALRAILELVADDAQTIPLADRQFLLDALRPFIQMHEEIELVRRHYGTT